MNQVLRPLLFLLLFAGFSQSLVAQSKTRPAAKQNAPKKKATPADIPPPPPMADIPQPEINFDTTAVVNDELTTEVRGLMNVMKFKENFYETVAQALDQNLGRQTPEIRKKFKERFMEELTNPQTMGWLENMYIRLYRENFTQAEIKELTQFYQSPLGKKFIAMSPAITSKVMEQAGKIGEYIGLKVGREIMNQNDKK